MQFLDLLREIRDLGFYDESEWEEYLSHFEDLDSIQRFLANQPRASGSELVNKIRSGKGTSPTLSDRSALPKLVALQELSRRKESTGMTLGVVSGAFDLLHLGHARSICFAKTSLAACSNARLCALTLVDEHITHKKGACRPVLNANERLILLSALRCIDYVALLEEPNCLAALRLLKPQFFFKAKDDLAQDTVRAEMRLAEDLGGHIVFFPATKARAVTTTRIIAWVSTYLDSNNHELKPGMRL